MAVNDPYEIYFGAMTGHVQYYGKIGLKNSGGIIQVRVNGDLSCGFDTGCKNKNTKRVEGIFYKLSEEMMVYPTKMCIEDLPAARTANQLDISKQLTENRRKEDLLRDKKVLDVSEKYIDELYYNEMFYSAAYWNTAAAVDREMKI